MNKMLIDAITLVSPKIGMALKSPVGALLTAHLPQTIDLVESAGKIILHDSYIEKLKTVEQTFIHSLEWLDNVIHTLITVLPSHIYKKH